MSQLIPSVARKLTSTYSKILDYAYEADRKMVSLVESLGVRESTSKSGQIGIPIAGAGAAG